MEENKPPFDDWIGFADDFDLQEAKKAILMLLEYLDLSLYRTNNTKHGNIELQIRNNENNF